MTLENNLIYISNTRIPSEKANSYQSMVMCESFSQYFDNVEFWYPKRKNTSKMDEVNDPFAFYNLSKNFFLKKLFTLDLSRMSTIFPKLWFFILNITFALNYTFKLRIYPQNTIVVTRDTMGLIILSFGKSIGFIKQNIYFEAHIYSPKISRLAKKVNGLIVINNYLKNLYKKDNAKNILVVHDGVKLEEYENIKPKNNTEIKQIVYIGNLFEWKGVYTLVDSLEYLDNDVELVIVGGSTDTLPKFSNYIKEKKIQNIELVGFVKKSETIKYIENADVLILPNSAKDKMSYYTSPLKLFEYMASNRPIVASKLPSLEEVLEDKKNAVLFTPDDSKDLADKINWVLTNDCKDIVISALNDVQEYTWLNRANKIVRWMKND